MNALIKSRSLSDNAWIKCHDIVMTADITCLLRLVRGELSSHSDACTDVNFLPVEKEIGRRHVQWNATLRSHVVNKWNI